MATRTPKTKAILIAHKPCRRVGRQSATNRLMRSSARSRGVFSGSTWYSSPSVQEKYGASHGLGRVRVGPRAFVSLHLYPAPQHVDPSHAAWGAADAVLALLRGGSMHDPASELPRILLPRTPVHKGIGKGRGCYA